VAFRELSKLNREMYLRAQIDELRKLYSSAQKKLTEQLAKSNITDFQKFRAKQLLAQVDVVTAQLNNGVYKWAKSSLPYAYDEGIDLAGERLKALKVTRFVSYDAKIHTSAVDALISDVSTELIMANSSIDKLFSRVALQTQQTALQDAEISRMISEGLIEGETRRGISNKILDELKTQLGEEKYLVINGKNYRPDKYAELVARTRTREATTQGTINTALRYGVDLVQWDAHAEVCEYCQQFSGRVYSISGQDSDFPQLTEKPPLHPNSYDKKTEIYTWAGWQNIKDVKIGDPCLSLNSDTFNLEWVKVKRTFKHKESKMISFSNRNLDLLVTHNHNMFYITDWNYKHNKKKFKFIEAEKLMGKKSGAFYRSSEWQGKNKRTVQLGDKEIPIELYAEFMGWYLSEGCSLPRTGRTFVQISQSKKVNLDKYESIEAMLNKIGFYYRAVDDGFIIPSKSLSLQMSIYGKCNEKYIPSIIKNAKPDVIKIFLDAFNLGDGSIRRRKFWKGGQFKDEKTYFTSSKRMADDIGELLLKVGKRPSFYLQKSKGKMIKHKNGNYIGNFDIYVIRECHSAYSTLINMEIKETSYNDYSYCVELDRNHTLWVRRNGKTAWCGNCRCVLQPITRENLESRGYLDEEIKLSNSPTIKVDSFSRFEEVLATI